MPTLQQLEQRLTRLNTQLDAQRQGGPENESFVELRRLKKSRRRLQRKLRARQPAQAVRPVASAEAVATSPAADQPKEAAPQADPPTADSAE